MIKALTLIKKNLIISILVSMILGIVLGHYFDLFRDFFNGEQESVVFSSHEEALEKAVDSNNFRMQRVINAYLNTPGAFVDFYGCQNKQDSWAATVAVERCPYKVLK